jgi:hypothetical protein
VKNCSEAHRVVDDRFEEIEKLLLQARNHMRKTISLDVDRREKMLYSQQLHLRQVAEDCALEESVLESYTRSDNIGLILENSGQMIRAIKVSHYFKSQINNSAFSAICRRWSRQPRSCWTFRFRSWAN